MKNLIMVAIIIALTSVIIKQDNVISKQTSQIKILEIKNKGLKQRLADTHKIGKKVWSKRTIHTQSPYSASSLLKILADELKARNATVVIHEGD